MAEGFDTDMALSVHADALQVGGCHRGDDDASGRLEQLPEGGDPVGGAGSSHMHAVIAALLQQGGGLHGSKGRGLLVRPSSRQTCLFAVSLGKLCACDELS